VIDVVTGVLRELGCIVAGADPHLHIGLTRGDTLWLDVFDARGGFVHVKTSDAISLGEEARVYHAAFGTYRDFMPQPLGYVVRDGWEIFACEGVAHRPLLAHHVLHGRGGMLAGYLAAARAARRPDAGVGHRPLLARLEAAYAGSRFDAALAPWRTARGRSELAAIGESPQHGDFVLNNLGLRRQGLVVFDWEDFGKITLPGLDLCTLLVSALGTDRPDAAEALAGCGAPGRRLAPAMRFACDALGLAVDQFQRLVPLHLLAFLQLKEGYATAVHDRIAGLLESVCATLPLATSDRVHG